MTKISQLAGTGQHLQLQATSLYLFYNENKFQMTW